MKFRFIQIAILLYLIIPFVAIIDSLIFFSIDNFSFAFIHYLKQNIFEVSLFIMGLWVGIYGKGVILK